MILDAKVALEASKKYSRKHLHVEEFINQWQIQEKVEKLSWQATDATPTFNFPAFKTWLKVAKHIKLLVNLVFIKDSFIERNLVCKLL